MPPAPYPLEPDDDRRARQLFVLKRLTDRGTTLALKAAELAEAELDAAAAARANAPSDPAPPIPREHHRIFDRYVRLVRQLIVAEHRIAHDIVTGATRRPYRHAGAVGDPTSDPRARPADPRREPLRQHIHKLTRSSPARAQLRRDAEASLDAALDRDAALTLPAGTILGEICHEYGLVFDIAHIPDAFLEPPITGPPDHIPR